MSDQVLNFLSPILNDPTIKYIAVFTVVNLLVAMAAAVKNSNFQIQKVVEFLYKKLLPYVGIYIGVTLLGEGSGFGWLSAASVVAITTALGSDLMDSLKQLGLPIPDGLVKPETLGSIADKKFIESINAEKQMYFENQIPTENKE